MAVVARLGGYRRARAIPFCPGKSDSQPVGFGESVVNLNAQIAHRALYAVELDCLVPRAGP